MVARQQGIILFQWDAMKMIKKMEMEMEAQGGDKTKTYLLEIPGKVMLSGGFIVLEGETCLAVSLSRKNTCRAAVEEGAFSVAITTSMRDRLSTADPGGECAPGDSGYLHSIVRLFYAATGLPPKNALRLHIDLDPSNFVDDDRALSSRERVKTGLGTSAVLIVAVVAGLYLSAHKFCREDVLATSAEINAVFSPKASGYDIFTVVMGSSMYSRASPAAYTPPRTAVVLGSFGKCTRSSEAIERVRSVGDTTRLKEINREIVAAGGGSKQAYRAYLSELRRVYGEAVVPERQYALLMATLSLDVVGCGVSGAGGEDAFWCLTAHPCEVEALWRERGVEKVWTDAPDVKGVEIALQ